MARVSAGDDGPELRTLSLTDRERLTVGLLIQPFVSAALAFLLFPVLLLDAEGRTFNGAFPSDATAAAASVAFGAGLLASVVTVFAAWPTALWVTKRRQVSLREALRWGLALGNLPVVVLDAFGARQGTPSPPAGLIHGVAFASLLGLGGAAVFWVIAIRRAAIESAPCGRASSRS